MTHRFATELQELKFSVRAAGKIALKYFHGEVKSWDKNPGDPVSEADLEIDAFLKEHLLTAHPDYGWLSEETADDKDRLTKSRVWIVDPIDGTRSFIAGKPEFTISAALVEEGKPVVAALFNPVTDEFFEAVEGQGSRLNGRKLECGTKTDLTRIKLLASRKAFEWHKWLNEVPGAEFDHLNSIAYRIAVVANKAFDASLSLSAKSDWDIAAADLILSEAGGITTTTKGEKLIYNQERPLHDTVISCGASLHPPLMTLLADFIPVHKRK
ncbi:3'(2'),5'-bisphosphate nucleotidase CysQ [Sneathiella glossodoripedis]|uniref:3'(2'),5'-bisphosphate nucleotidase CysQ n=1 Tax=Sneathiella glossodoripedis TaxID=418853 RepID=UPI0004714AAD|nr:3'(2'),5'-bisphosphate nucleotidase CysQ [Sneathiella glossodoripedis]